MKKRRLSSYFNYLIVILIGLLTSAIGFGQFAGPAGHASSTAIAMDSSVIVGWANDCSVERGWMDITNPSLGLAYNGLEVLAVGPADETGVISLGDSGIAILTFPHPIFNGAGPDIVIFENSFSDSFLELGHVEVSSDGINFFRFPSTCQLQSIIQNGPFDQFGDAEKIHNLAGKYRGGFGTPFDLEELSGITNLNVNAITHVKIIDAVGSIDPTYGTSDQNGNLINDPFPTPFPSSGIDIDAVGACYMVGLNNLEEVDEFQFEIFPNPSRERINITLEMLDGIEVIVVDNAGKSLIHSTSNSIDISALQAGSYLLKVTLPDGKSSIQRFTKL